MSIDELLSNLTDSLAPLVDLRQTALIAAETIQMQAAQLASARKALEEINGQAVCNVMATHNECFDMLQNCAEISEAALQELSN